jgi:hypothetical protein
MPDEDSNARSNPWPDRLRGLLLDDRNQGFLSFSGYDLYVFAAIGNNYLKK